MGFITKRKILPMTSREQLEYIWLVDSLIFSETGKHIDSLTRKIIEGILTDNTYSEIGEKLGYDPGYIGDKTRIMLRILSKKTGEIVNKQNFSWVLERILNTDHSPSIINLANIKQ
jgi:hypothetical protein